ncbi:leucine-rich repeat flightless-interacting protein 2 isoform X3 [Scyliorhinus canicula]|uniref:leucine-rich repeat flightless-interacting protein 2 isoform X3 n=1 Tax=Scyliorhinus canicula TaxID=7830 RepID=UPI0018F3E21F|nr:leucine-rich repeat flightless-interacting protein 2 isoform X3 [Scyliorhinus canicula]XP_038665760.1 leucine-rich repeat flightless-interacting protein 2 isoform X3 [Scyliorhinus canicula]
MGTPGAGRKRTPIKDRFSAEDEALSHIAREAEARLAAKRAARAEARDIRMKELERQQKEIYRSSGRKWGEIHQWMENTERAKYSYKPSQHHSATNEGALSVYSYGSQRHSSFDVGLSHRSSSRRNDLAMTSRAKDKSAHLEKTFRVSSIHNDAHAVRKKLSTSNDGSLSGMYHSQRKYNTLNSAKSFSSYTRPSSLYSAPFTTAKNYRASSNLDTGLIRSQSLVSLYDEKLNSHNRRNSSRTPSEYSYSSRASSVHTSPMNSDDETMSNVSQDSFSRGRRDSVVSSSSDFSDHNGSIADYFSRSNRRGSMVSDLDDTTVPDLFSLDEKTESFSRPASRNAVAGLSAATLASLGGSSSRRGSGDTSSILDPDVSLSELRDIYELKDQIQDVEGRYMQGLKELKDSLSEVEEKYKKAMVSNAQLDNEKSNLIYQVDTLKDVIEEMEEQMAELNRENVEKSKELERQKHMSNVSQHKVEELKEGIQQRDKLIEENKCLQQRVDTLTRDVFDLQETVNWKEKKIGALERQKDYFDCIRKERDELRDELADLSESKKKHGLVIIPEGTPNGDVNHEPVIGAITVVSQEAAQVLESAGDGPLDVRLKKLADEKEELLAQIRKLKLQFEEERQKNSKIENVLTDSDRLENGTDLQMLEMQRDVNRQLSEYKFKLSKAEQDIATVEQNVVRLEGQVFRYKTATENSEKIEDELKAEKRRLQRELRSALDKNEEMEMTNSHLMKRLEKMKANRNALLSQQ